jgi:hypothetical protein
MPRNVLMSDLVLRAQRRTDKENDLSVPTLEWKALINTTYGDLYSEVERSGMRYFESTASIAATGAASYTLATDLLGTIGIDFLYDGTTTGRRRQLRELMVQERTAWAGMTGDAQGFQVVGQKVFLYPNPTTGTYEMIYMPQSPDISAAADGTNVDVVTPDGEEFIIWGVAVKALAKSNDDTQLAEREREAARVRFMEWAVLRAFNEPRHRIVQGSGSILDDPYGDMRDEGGWWNR